MKTFFAGCGLWVVGCGLWVAGCVAVFGQAPLHRQTFTTNSATGFSISGTNFSMPGDFRANAGIFTNDFRLLTNPIPFGVLRADLGGTNGNWSTNLDTLNLTNLTVNNFFGKTIINTNTSTIEGDAYIIVGGSPSSTTNALSLTNSYALAKLKTPHGLALSATNRFTIYLMPGRYTIVSGQLLMDTQFIDLIGLGNDARDVRVESTGIAVRITADDVTCRRFTTYTTAASPTANTDPTGFHPDNALGNLKALEMIFDALNNVAAMRPGIGYSGYYQDCICTKSHSFGASISTSGGVASGTFIRCQANGQAFGSVATGSVAPIASGFFLDCEASGGSFASRGTASGIFWRCRGGSITVNTIVGQFAGSSGGSFGGADSGTVGTASGDFYYCYSEQTSFGAAVGGGVASGNFFGCTVASDSGTANGFGASSTTAGGSFSGKAYGCQVRAGRGFGAAGASGGSHTGTSIDCSFGATGVGWATLTGTIQRCTFPNWGEIYAPNTADSLTLTNSAAENNFSVTQSLGAYNWKIGKAFQIQANGKYSTDVATAGTLVLKLKLGSTAIVTSGAFTLPTSAANRGWKFVGSFTTRTIGASGTISAEGIFWIDDALLGAESVIPSNGTKTIDTTAAQTLQISETFSVADNDNAITLENLHVVPLSN